MFRYFYPDVYMESTYHINFKKLYQKGYRGIIFDVDNTLVPHNAPADERSILLFKELKEMGYEAMLMSNNKEPRVKLFHEKVGVDYIFKANKPAKKSYLLAMEKMKTNKNNTLFVGDQLFTDILGAKRVGIRAYLVKPMNPKEEIQIVLKRYLEKIVLSFYKRSLMKRKKK